MPSLVQLQYALAVEQHRHFGKAAKFCHVTQPTLSQQLQKLEEEVGIVLFDRLKKPVLPTPEGQLFLQQARVVLREQDKLLHIAQQSRTENLSGDFRLGVIPTVASDLLPLFLEAFASAYPQVRLFIEELTTDIILARLERDALDGAILATPIAGAQCTVRPLYYEPFCVYLSAGHPLLGKKLLVKDDLDAREIWLLQDGHCFKEQVLDFCGVPGTGMAPTGSINFRSGSLSTLCRLVQRGHGFTLIPAMLSLSLPPREREAHVRSFKAPVPVREVSLIHRREHWKVNIVEAIHASVVKHLPATIHRSREKAMQVMAVKD